MNTRQKRKTALKDSEGRTGVEMIARSLGHLNRTLRQFSDGLQSRTRELQERLFVEPLESAAWVVSRRVRRVQNRVFDFIDGRISKIDERRRRKLDHQTALERFDGEGGAMRPTTPVGTSPPTETASREKPGPSPNIDFEPSLSH